MPFSEIPDFLNGCRRLDVSIGRLALQFAILTACRSGEVRRAVWSEIDWERAQWNIASDRMKAGEPHSVPLSSGALDVLKTVRDMGCANPENLIFPGTKGQPLSDMTLGKALRSSNGGQGPTVHGFRSSFRDWVAEKTNYPGDWAEAALAHSLPNKVEAAYRRTKFLEQRRAMMEHWSHYVLADAGSAK